MPPMPIMPLPALLDEHRPRLRLKELCDQESVEAIGTIRICAQPLEAVDVVP